MAESIDTPTQSWPRLMAIALTMGGLFWGMILLLTLGPDVLFMFPFDAGYLVTLGYIVRAVSVPAFGVRLSIWIVSLAVHGYSLVFVGIPDLQRTGPDPFLFWWLFATVCSVIAIATERRNRLA